MTHHQVHLAAAAAAVIRAHVAAFEGVLKGIDPDQYLCSEGNLREEAIRGAGNHHVNFIRQDMTERKSGSCVSKHQKSFSLKG